MPYADYRCRECGRTILFWQEDLSKHPFVDEPHHRADERTDDKQPVECSESRMDRVWKSPSIGRVPGAGGSPAR